MRICIWKGWQRLSKVVTVTLILCTCDRPEMIKRLLSSLEELTVKPDQIIIVDASEGEATSEVVAGFSGLQIEYYRSSKGLTYQRNVGLTKAKCDVAGFLDDDIVPDRDCFEQLKSVFSDDSIYGVVPYIYENNEQVLSGFNGFCFRITSKLWGRKYIAKALGKNYVPDEVFSGIVDDVVANGCSFYRKAVFEEFSFADWMEGYCYGEDAEFGLRVSKQHKIIGSGDVRLHHWHTGTGKGNPFVVSEMSVYNYVRIIGISGQNYIIARKMDIVLRRFACTVFHFIISLLKLRIKPGLLSLAGGAYGVIRSFPWIIKRQL